MRPQDHGLVNTFACFHHQEHVWLLPVGFFSTDCAPPIVMPFSSGNPPNVVVQRETVTMRAQIRHCNASLPHRWRDDASQVICTSYHDFLDGAQLSCLILRHLLESFLYSVKSPFRGFHFISESVFLYFSHSPFSALQSVLSQHLTCSKYFLAGDFSCHWHTVCPACFSSSASSRNFCTSDLSWKIFPHFSFVQFLSHHFPKPSTMRLFLHKLTPLPLCQWFLSFCLQ